MLNIMRLCLGTIARLFCARRSLLLENLALRQQLAVFKRRHPRTRLTFLDKLFWVAARQIWSDWKQFLIVVLPDTVVQWHRSGFALYWRLISRFPGRAGRKRISKEIRNLIFRMVAENPTWGAPRIHGELLMLGCDVPSEPSPAGCAKRREIPSLRNAGLHSCATIEKPLRRWTSSPCQQSPSVCSTAFLSSATTVGAFCTSTSRGTRRACGLSSS